MQMFRDKKSIFILAAELLTRIVNASSDIKVILLLKVVNTLLPILSYFFQEICNGPMYRKRLDGILHIIERKNRLEVRVRSVTVNIVVSKSPDEFNRYKGKNYESIEPIVCIQHLMRLLNE